MKNTFTSWEGILIPADRDAEDFCDTRRDEKLLAGPPSATRHAIGRQPAGARPRREIQAAPVGARPRPARLADDAGGRGVYEESRAILKVHAARRAHEHKLNDTVAGTRPRGDRLQRGPARAAARRAPVMTSYPKAKIDLEYSRTTASSRRSERGGRAGRASLPGEAARHRSLTLDGDRLVSSARPRTPSRGASGSAR